MQINEKQTTSHSKGRDFFAPVQATSGFLPGKGAPAHSLTHLVPILLVVALLVSNPITLFITFTSTHLHPPQCFCSTTSSPMTSSSRTRTTCEFHVCRRASPGCQLTCCRSKEVGDIAYEVDCTMIVVKEGDVDIGKSRLSWKRSVGRSKDQK